MTLQTINFEAMLLRWSETSNGGSTIVLQLVDDGDLAPFKGMTLKKGKIAGQRLQCVMVEIGDDELPKDLPDPGKGGPLSQLAARWCKDPEFQEWLMTHAASTNVSVVGEYSGRESWCAAMVRVLCGIESRKELDHQLLASQMFDCHIRRPYMEHLQSGNRFAA